MAENEGLADWLIWYATDYTNIEQNRRFLAVLKIN